MKSIVLLHHSLFLLDVKKDSSHEVVFGWELVCNREAGGWFGDAATRASLQKSEQMRKTEAAQDEETIQLD